MRRQNDNKKTTASGPPQRHLDKAASLSEDKGEVGKKGRFVASRNPQDRWSTQQLVRRASTTSTTSPALGQVRRGQHQTAVARSSKNTSDGRAVQTKRRSLFQLSNGARAAYSSSARAAASRATEATIEAAEQRAFWSVFSDTLHSLLHSGDASTVSRAVSASVADS